MRVAIAGGHGQIALLLERILADSGHESVALIRDPAQSDDVRAAGAEPIVVDLEHVGRDMLAAHLEGCDAVVFAAGAGSGSGADRKLTLDRDGAILLADAAELGGIRRYVLLSAMGADTFHADSDDVFQVYLKAKAQADAAIRDREALDWTIVRPGSLTDEDGTGSVSIGEHLVAGSIPRADVAAVIAVLLESGSAIHEQFEVTSGPEPIAQVL